VINPTKSKVSNLVARIDAAARAGMLILYWTGHALAFSGMVWLPQWTASAAHQESRSTEGGGIAIGPVVGLHALSDACVGGVPCRDLPPLGTCMVMQLHQRIDS